VALKCTEQPVSKLCLSHEVSQQPHSHLIIIAVKLVLTLGSGINEKDGPRRIEKNNLISRPEDYQSICPTMADNEYQSKQVNSEYNVSLKVSCCESTLSTIS
jgi:hypothetical protein